MKYRCVLPLLIMVLLLLAMSVRYDVKKTTSEGYIFEWKTDRWTGDIWWYQYRPAGEIRLSLVVPNEKAASWKEEDAAALKNTIAMSVWGVLSVISFIWFLVSIRKDYRAAEKGETTRGVIN